MTTTALEILAKVKDEDIAHERLEPCKETFCPYASTRDNKTICCYGIRNQECYVLNNAAEVAAKLNIQEYLKDHEQPKPRESSWLRNAVNIT
jgi:hypothetical protein